MAAVWDALDPASLQKLLGINTAVKRVVQDHLTYIKMGPQWQMLDMKCLVTGSWSRLASLDLADGHLDAFAAVQLGSVYCPRLQRLSIAENFGPFTAGARAYRFKNFQGNWPHLKVFRANLKRLLDKSELLALVELDWPCLESVTLQVSPSAFPILTKARWPCLKHVAIGRLHAQCLDRFGSLPWPLLQHLELECYLKQHNINHIVCLSQANFPCLKHVSIHVIGPTAGLQTPTAFMFSPLLKAWPSLQLTVWTGTRILVCR